MDTRKNTHDYSDTKPVQQFLKDNNCKDLRIRQGDNGLYFETGKANITGPVTSAELKDNPVISVTTHKETGETSLLLHNPRSYEHHEVVTSFSV